MKPIAILLSAVFAIFALCAFAHAEAAPQVFPTTAGPVRITPLNHASTLIEAGGKVIYLDPAKPARFSGHPKADLILITTFTGTTWTPIPSRKSARRTRK